MPEFLTEKNWREDFVNNNKWIFGIYENCPEITQNNFKNKITLLINNAYDNKSIKHNNIIFCSNKEVELLKLIKTDERIGNIYIDCLGNYEKSGYSEIYFPKDTNSMYFQLIENNIDIKIFETNLHSNEIIDRPERDWLIDKERTNIKNNNFKIILVTGGAGFLGRHLCKKLLENKSNKVICLDNLITGKESNINEFKTNRNFKFLKFDITKKIFLHHVDEIYNLASLASPDKYKAYPIETIMVNFMGTKNTLDLACIHNAKILLTSTSEVYGDPLIHPQPEEYYGNVNTIGERSCYDESKRLAETLMYEYKKKYLLDTKIVRIFNTYGPFMDEKDGRVITNFLYKINTNKPLEIYGSGEQTRSFCYVDDLIDGLIAMMDSQESGPINLGNPNCEFTLNELVVTLEKITNKKLEIKYLPSTENDPKCRKPIIDKAINKLNWFPKINLEEGLKKMILFNPN